MSARLLLEYDGAAFSGWARQPGLRTVEAVLEDALTTVLGDRVPLTVAGRTDAGVHARGQVASHPGRPAPAGALNALLPPDLRVLASETAPDNFDARRDASSRRYRYRLHTRPAASVFERGRALHWPHPLERTLLDACAEATLGTHDFTAFTPTQTAHTRFERTVTMSRWAPGGEHALEYHVEADSFMRHMVRTLVGSMLAVAGGRFDVAWFEGLLEGRPRAEAGDTASSAGLYLEAVGYRAGAS